MLEILKQESGDLYNIVARDIYSIIRALYTKNTKIDVNTLELIFTAIIDAVNLLYSFNKNYKFWQFRDILLEYFILNTDDMQLPLLSALSLLISYSSKHRIYPDFKLTINTEHIRSFITLYIFSELEFCQERGNFLKESFQKMK